MSATVFYNLSTYRPDDIEKTVVDIIYYRNKIERQIGIEETKEILTNYLNWSNRDIIRKSVFLSL